MTSDDMKKLAEEIEGWVAQCVGNEIDRALPVGSECAARRAMTKNEPVLLAILARYVPVSEKCFACDKPIIPGMEKWVLVGGETMTVPVGRECCAKVRKMDRRGGYKPPKGGPALFLIGIATQPPTTPKGSE